ncbi:GNAT family N-acetyltransferase [Macrococcus sp. EM39E]|uniref:GNAT family N-acetyltransferase n=1 Tax=Macrococcus animalis TaxID=3395467 RepID=UPI0039BFCC39
MYKVEIMNKPTAEIISKWDFGKDYSFYNIEEDPFVIETFLNGHYYIVYFNDEIFGFFCDGESARMNENYELKDEVIDIGFALNPMFIGRGLGVELLKIIFDYYHEYKIFRLTVADFNQRAIRLYKKIGFQFERSYTEMIDGQLMQFNIMILNQPQDRCNLHKSSVK